MSTSASPQSIRSAWWEPEIDRAVLKRLMKRSDAPGLYFLAVWGALLAATAWGAPMMKLGKELGYIREGCLADILLIDGDPLDDITILQHKERILAVMKDGVFHRAPPVRGAQPWQGTTRWAA